MMLILSACGDAGTIFTQVTVEETFQQAASNEVDVLWVVDDTPSMQTVQAQVAAAAGDFLDVLVGGDMDFHVGVTTMDTSAENSAAGQLLGNPTYVTPDSTDYLAWFEDTVIRPEGTSDQERGFEAAIVALSAPLADTDNQGFSRSDVMKSIVFVTNEDDCSGLPSGTTGEECSTRASELTPVEDLVAALEDIADPALLTINGIIGPPLIDNCDAAAPGSRYDTAIDATGGAHASICDEDYATFMEQLGLLASGVFTTFELSRPAEEDTLEVEVVTFEGETTSVLPDASNGWTYDAEYVQIEFHGDAVPPRESTVVVRYEVAAD